MASEHHGVNCPHCGQPTDAGWGSPYYGTRLPVGMKHAWELDRGPHTCPNCRAVFRTEVLGVDLVGDELTGAVVAELLSTDPHVRPLRQS